MPRSHEKKKAATTTNTTKSTSSSIARKEAKAAKASVIKASLKQQVMMEPIDDAESDPEDSLAPNSLNKTVHWDPQMGKLVGWKIRIWDTKAWRDGRIMLYDTYTNKHKVRMDSKVQGLDNERSIWLRLIHEVSWSL